MTDQERQDIKAKLIEFGIWSTYEIGDPLTSNQDARVVRLRLQEWLADSVLLASTGSVGDSPARHIDVVRGEFSYRIADGEDYPEAICLAALALPEFLKQHPECAAEGYMEELNGKLKLIREIGREIGEELGLSDVDTRGGAGNTIITLHWMDKDVAKHLVIPREHIAQFGQDRQALKNYVERRIENGEAEETPR